MQNVNQVLGTPRISYSNAELTNAVERLAKLPAPTICPCCKSAISVKIPIVDLNTNTVSWQGKSTRLSRQKVALLSLLLRRHPSLVSYEQLIIHLWGDDEGENARNDIGVHICQLRQAVRPLGIHIVNLWGQGFRLELAQ